MRRFESLAVDRYATHAPALLLDAKRAFVAELESSAADDAALAASALDRPIGVLLGRAQSPDEAATLLVQGLVLESLAQAIYRLVAGKDRDVSETSRMRAAGGLAASQAVSGVAAARTAEGL